MLFTDVLMQSQLYLNQLELTDDIQELNRSFTQELLTKFGLSDYQIYDLHLLVT